MRNESEKEEKKGKRERGKEDKAIELMHGPKK